MLLVLPWQQYVYLDTLKPQMLFCFLLLGQINWRLPRTCRWPLCFDFKLLASIDVMARQTQSGSWEATSSRSFSDGLHLTSTADFKLDPLVWQLTHFHNCSRSKALWSDWGHGLLIHLPRAIQRQRLPQETLPAIPCGFTESISPFALKHLHSTPLRPPPTGT